MKKYRKSRWNPIYSSVPPIALFDFNLKKKFYFNDEQFSFNKSSPCTSDKIHKNTRYSKKIRKFERSFEQYLTFTMLFQKFFIYIYKNCFKFIPINDNCTFVLSSSMKKAFNFSYIYVNQNISKIPIRTSFVSIC